MVWFLVSFSIKHPPLSYLPGWMQIHYTKIQWGFEPATCCTVTECLQPLDLLRHSAMVQRVARSNPRRMIRRRLTKLSVSLVLVHYFRIRVKGKWTAQRFIRCAKDTLGANIHCLYGHFLPSTHSYSMGWSIIIKWINSFEKSRGVWFTFQYNFYFILRRNCYLSYANSEDPDQTPHLRRLIWVFAVCQALGINWLISGTKIQIIKEKPMYQFSVGCMRSF